MIRQTSTTPAPAGAASPPTAPPLPLRIRPADPTDARWAAGLWAEAFPGEPRPEVRLQALLEETGPYGGLETCWVAESEGRLVGAFRHYSLTMHLWGRAFPTQGLASVAVTPSARRRGFGRALCEHALALAREKGSALSALYPFRTDFYGRIGYVLAGDLHRYRFAARDLVTGAARPAERITIERIARGEAHRTLPLVYDALLPRSNGLVERTPEMWRGILDGGDHAYIAVDETGAHRGYLLARGRRGRSPDRSLLRVRECLALDASARAALLRWIADQRDQWSHVQYDALPGEEFHRHLAHPRTPGRPQARGLWFHSATMLRGPMVRIVDPARVLDILGHPSGAPTAPGEGTRVSAHEEIARLTEEFIAGRLPGQAEAVRSFRPALDLTDFRLLDIF